VIATVEGRKVLVGNPALLLENGVEIGAPIEESRQTPVHVAVDGKLAGVVFIADALRPGSKEALAALKAGGVKRLVMVTGDNAARRRPSRRGWA